MTKKIKHIHCPANGWDCPYYTNKNHPCRCILPHPEEDCDDFNYFWEDYYREDWIDDDWEIDDGEILNEPMYLDRYSSYGAGDVITYDEAYDRAAEVVSISDMWEQLDHFLYSSKEWSPENLLNYLPEEMRQELFDRAVKDKFDAFYTEIREGDNE